MQNKISINTNIGMLRDRSISKVDNQFAFENHNIRITARDKDTLLSVTNERGNLPINITPYAGELGVSEIEGILLGYSVLNNYIILFTHDDIADRIYSVEYIKKDSDIWEGKKLYEGNLDFSVNFPIETIPLYETEDVQKVYWVDGKNQPRFINIKRNYFSIVRGQLVFAKNTIFDFVTDYKDYNGKFNVTIEKQHLGLGSFTPGTVQYICTYYNKFGQETNPIYISPVCYISPESRGGSPEETVTCSFKISVSNTDTEFEYIRIYAICRTSESGTPTSYIVGDIQVSTEVLTVVDTGQGDNVAIDPTILLYIGGKELVAGTMSHKDNTLFLGDLTLKASEKDALITNAINSANVYNKNTYQSNIVSFFKSTGSLNAPYYKNNAIYSYESQLNYSSDAITGYKGGEKYRFGLQFITSTGQRSQVFFIGDKTNNIYPSINESAAAIQRPLVRVTIPKAVATAALNAGYVQATLQIAEASDGDRTILAQGIVSPTVFNLSQRYSNAPYAISSWFMRPRNTEMNSRHFESVNNFSSVSETDDEVSEACVSFCEIQNITPNVEPYFDDSSFEGRLLKIAFSITSYCNNPGNTSNWGFMNYNHYIYAVYLFTDANNQPVWKKSNDYNSETVTYQFPADGNFSSADWEELRQKKYRIGKKTGNFSSKKKRYNVILEILQNNGITDKTQYPSQEQVIHQHNGGEYFDRVITLDIADSSNKSLYSRLHREQYYIDENIVTLNSPDITNIQSLDTTGIKFRIVGITKPVSNISDYSILTTTGRSNAAAVYKTSFNHFNSSYIEGLGAYPLLYDAAPNLDENDNVIEEGGTPYYFNIFPFHKEGSVIYNETLSNSGGTPFSAIEKKTFANLRYCYSTEYLWTGSAAWRPKTTPAVSIIANSDNAQYRQLITNSDRYIYQSTYDYLSPSSSSGFGVYGVPEDKDLAPDSMRQVTSRVVTTSKEPVRIQFVSTEHAAIKFAKYNGANEILPATANENSSSSSQYTLAWNDTSNIYQQKLSTSIYVPYYFVGELYRDFSSGDDRYGGNTEFAVKNNNFITVSKRYNINGDGFEIIGTEGDTYFQRWDCVKTLPYTKESKNGIVDITSFMVETHRNIEGRYDNRRGMLENVTTTSTNFNLMNSSYNNSGNFFSSKVLDSKYNLSAFPNQITWSKTKTFAEDIDTWTNITVASTLDLDGDKGRVRAIRRFNNALIAFQDTGISEILFNSRVQMATTAGVPIELMNSGKVEGKRYISDKIGCINKWSIVETKSGIYFIDNTNKNISVINQGIADLSTVKGFGSWIRSYNSLDIWNPVDKNNFVGFYDKIHGDIYFIRKHQDAYNNDSCLVFNETIGQFTSFFDYDDVPMMLNVRDRFVSFKDKDKDKKLWLQNEGEYNNIFGIKYPYWITYRVCPNPYTDKTFNNIEYRADIIARSTSDDMIEYPDNLITDKTFDKLDVWNEYQFGTVNLDTNKYKVADIKKKFRIWRANIPRDSKDSRGLNRIRNPWIFLKLTKDSSLEDERMEFHDLLVKYYE